MLYVCKIDLIPSDVWVLLLTHSPDLNYIALLSAHSSYLVYSFCIISRGLYYVNAILVFSSFIYFLKAKSNGSNRFLVAKNLRKDISFVFVNYMFEKIQEISYFMAAIVDICALYNGRFFGAWDVFHLYTHMYIYIYYNSNANVTKLRV